MIDFETVSNRNMSKFFRYELLQVAQGQRLDHGIIRTLKRLGFIVSNRHGTKPTYQLIEKARELLKGSGP